MRHTLSLRIFRFLFLPLFLAVGGSELYAQEIALPVSVQVPLLMKIISFDRNLKTRVGDEIVIGILYQEKFRSSFLVKNDFMSELPETSSRKIGGLSVRSVPIDLSDDPDLVEIITRERINLLYIAPLRAVDVETITSVSHSKGILTLTGVPEYVEAGLAVGIGTKGEKPMIIVNVVAAKAEGADFNSQLLRLARVIQ